MKKINYILIFLLLLMFGKNPVNAQTVGPLIGMTYNGGSAFGGTLFSYDPLTSSYNVLHNFYGNLTDGTQPVGSVIQGRNGIIYGMTATGGNYGDGVLFSFNLATNYEVVLHSFGGINDGSIPYGTLIEANDSMLYGMTNQGGLYGLGVLFRFNPTTWQDTVLLNFNDSNGATPFASLIQAKDGKFYGMTPQGGVHDSGVIFRFDPVTYKDTVLISFTHSIGTIPYGSLVENKDGLFYGFTSLGGSNNGGVLFSYNPVTGKDSVLRNLRPATGYGPSNGALAHDTNGVLYGANLNDTLGYPGNLFSYNPTTDTYTVLQHFTNIGDSGAYPYNGPILASDGQLYGMTTQGGINNGELFSYNLGTMKEAPLYSFTFVSGYSPFGGLTEVMWAQPLGRDSLKCYGDSNGWVKLIVRGAKPPFHYLWSNGSTIDSIGGLKTGTYTCVITDTTGRTYTDQVIIYQPQKLNANVSVKNTCGGNNGIAWAATAGGTTPYMYSWSNGATTDTITNLAPGMDTCIVTDKNGCVSMGEVKVDTAQPMRIDSIKTTRTSCYGCSDGTATVYVSGGIPSGDSATYFYVWTYGGDSAHVAGLPAGIDSICVTSYYGCGSVCWWDTVPMSVAEINNQQGGINIYPVPSTGIVNLSVPDYYPGINSNVEVYNVLGEKVYRGVLPAGDNQIKIDLTEQPNGVYILQLRTNTSIISRELVIQK